MAKLDINIELCKGCNLCVHYCPKKILRIVDKYNRKGYKFVECTDISKCIACAHCAIMCPDCAIVEVSK